MNNFLNFQIIAWGFLLFNHFLRGFNVVPLIMIVGLMIILRLHYEVYNG